MEFEYKFDVHKGHIKMFDNKQGLLCTANCFRIFGDKEKISREDIRVGNLRGTLFTPVASGRHYNIIRKRPSTTRN